MKTKVFENQLISVELPSETTAMGNQTPVVWEVKITTRKTKSNGSFSHDSVQTMLFSTRQAALEHYQYSDLAEQMHPHFKQLSDDHYHAAGIIDGQYTAVEIGTQYLWVR